MIRDMARWARVSWHLAGSPEKTFLTPNVPLDEDPAADRTRIRAHIAARHLGVADAAPLVRLDKVEEYTT